MNYKALELKLRGIVEKRLQEGYCIRTGLPSYSTGKGECCAVGVIAPYSYHPWTSEIGRLLGIDVDTVLAISDGFENFADGRFDRSASMPELKAIGARIRRDYCEWTNE